jgi:hypothetical protein
MRTPANDQDAAVVHVEEVAYGLSGLECPIFADPQARWMAADQQTRDLYRAKARFVLGLAEDVDAAVLDRGRGALRWNNE